MKGIRLSLVLVLVLVALLWMAPVAYADDGDDPDIVVNIGVGGDSEVNVDVGGNSDVSTWVGDDSSIYINGKLQVVDNSPGFVYDEWSRNKIKRDIFPWMEEAGRKIGLTIDGLAKVILTVQGTDSSLEDVRDELRETQTEISTNYESIQALERSVQEASARSRMADIELNVRLNDLEAKYIDTLRMAALALGILFAFVVPAALLSYRRLWREKVRK